MKRTIKFSIVSLFLGFCSSHSMIIQRTFQKSKILINRHYATNAVLGKYYLTTPWWFEDTDEKTIKEAADNLKKYASFLYTQCHDVAEKQHIKKLLKHNSALAQERLKISQKAMTICIFAGASSGWGALACYGLMCKDPSYASWFVVNTSLFVINGFRVKSELEDLKMYRAIVEVEEIITDYDKIQLKEFKGDQD